MPDTIITITGPTCSGKTHLVRYLQTRGIHEVRSFTTRPPRANELTEGPDRAYDFVDLSEAERIQENVADLIDCVNFHGNIYGNTVSQMREALDLTFAATGGRLATVVVEPNGVDHWRDAARIRGDFKVFAIYLHQPLDTLMTRFQERLANASTPTARAYELGRQERMCEVEFPTWGKIRDYDLRITNLDLKDVPDAPSLEMLYDFLRFQFGLNLTHSA